jgi:nitroreductase
MPTGKREKRAHGESAARCASAPKAAQLESVLRKRRSVRAFAPDAVPAESVARAIDAAIEADCELWGPEVDAGVELELVLVAWDVTTLRPGVHVRTGEEFCRIASLPDRSAHGAIALQTDLQSAPALLLASGNLLAACALHGDHGYRMLLTRAGAACQTAWLAAIDSGLAGAVFAGFQPAAARHILGASMARRQLLALALGLAASGRRETIR